MAETIESNAQSNEGDALGVTRRSRSQRAVSSRATSVATKAPARPRSARSAVKPLKSLAILTMVGGLIATVALPAYGAFRPTVTEEPVTLQQVAADDAQSLVVGSDATGSELTRDSYSATTQAEIDEKKAKEAAAAAAAARARAAAAAAAAAATSTPVDITLVSPGSGAVRWPITNFTKGRGLWDSGYHQGVDLLASCGTPLYAAAGGVVRVSQESFGGYGVAVTIDHVINGQRVSTLYGHMTYGSRMVSSGQTVSAGQQIGVVGSTGSSTACHLHFEVHINDSVVDPWAWLVNNAG
ncbi:M23 family metallopeptidase [Microbacterium hominis]|uniref:M23 family metallopeptidase n=1 Tax=Microbacterium hominis TaxID=162426 RepID=A0A7D4Q024_9MICO|nr:M23 family metallopeptidase [Microbacterium hominis]QKJ18852.1 M23 family metallopeptidase [Microbacterium hominis]